MSNRNKYKFTEPAKPNNIDSFSVKMASVPIPEITPQQVKNLPTKWVPYGPKNNFPNYLMSSVKKSTKHSAFISLRENLIKGAGLSYSDNLKAFFDNLDEEGNTVDELVASIATDLSILETFAVMVRYDATRTIIRCLDYIDSSQVRVAKIEQTPEEIAAGELPVVKGYFLCADWMNPNQNLPLYIEKFNPFPRDNKGEVTKPTSSTQLYYYHKRANGNEYLPEISYASALDLIEADNELKKYSFNSLSNGFFASAIMEVNASLSDEQKYKLKADMDSNFKGTDNASNLMVVISETPGSIKISPISTGDDTAKLKAFEDIILAGIATAHRGQPILAGVQSQGASLGGDGNIMLRAQKHFYNMVIVHLQKPILAFLEKVLKFNGFDKSEYQLEIQSVNFDSIPDGWEADNVKPEVLAAKYGYKPEDLLPPINPAPLDAPDAPLLDGEAA